MSASLLVALLAAGLACSSQPSGAAGPGPNGAGSTASQGGAGSGIGHGGRTVLSGVNKMLNSLLNAAGVTKTGGAPTDDFGDASLPKGTFSEVKA